MTIPEHQHWHSSLMRRVMSGETVRVRLYNGTIATVAGYSAWDEGLSVSQNGRSFREYARVEIIDAARD